MAATGYYGPEILIGDEIVGGLAVVVEDGVITAIVPRAELPATVQGRDLGPGVLAPGFIDTQVNGGGGALFNAAPDVATLRTIGAAHRRFGTTGFLPTVISDDIGVVERAVAAVGEAMAQGVPGVLGIHIEGPMLAPTRHGIHDPRFLIDGSAELIDAIGSLGRGRTVVTLAPEVVSPELIGDLVARGVIVSAGHTEASYEQMRAGFSAGITGVTHLFNAMSPLANRAPGAVGAALEDAAAWCGIILDGVHVHPATLRIAMRCHPLDRFLLVTDAMTPVGTDAATFDLQGREIFVAGDRCVDAQGTLAGSNLTMDRAVRNAVELLDLPLATALRLASSSPAAFLGMAGQRGSIAVGKMADLVLLDTAWRVAATWIAGLEQGEA